VQHLIYVTGTCTGKEVAARETLGIDVFIVIVCVTKRVTRVVVVLVRCGVDLQWRRQLQTSI